LGVWTAILGKTKVPAVPAVPKQTKVPAVPVHVWIASITRLEQMECSEGTGRRLFCQH